MRQRQAKDAYIEIEKESGRGIFSGLAAAHLKDSMIKVLECLDIELIERLRREYIHMPLDEHDSFSYHLVIEADGAPLGTARLYKRGGGLRIDCIATAEGGDLRYRDMLARSIISRAVDLTDGYITIDDGGADLYSELGFKRENGLYVAASKDVVFKCKCKKP